MIAESDAERALAPAARAASFWRRFLWSEQPDPCGVRNSSVGGEDIWPVLAGLFGTVLPTPVRYFEPGFGFARNLVAIHQHIGGEPWGCDLDDRAVAHARRALPMGHFWRASVREFLEAPPFDAGFFDLTVTRSFLAFLPLTEERDRFIRALMHASRAIIAFEVTGDDEQRVQMDGGDAGRYTVWGNYDRYGWGRRTECVGNLSVLVWCP